MSRRTRPTRFIHIPVLIAALSLAGAIGCGSDKATNPNPNPGSGSTTYTGTVTGKSRQGNDGIVEIEFRAINDRGEHLSGTAVIGLPLNGKRA